MKPVCRVRVRVRALVNHSVASCVVLLCLNAYIIVVVIVVIIIVVTKE